MTTRILIVEDEVTLSLFLQRYLSAVRPGDVVETVTTVHSALGRLERTAYDLIIADHILPDATGFSVLQKACHLNPSPRLILMTGYTSPALEHATAEMGAAWIAKPFNLHAMRDLVAACLGEPTPMPHVLPHRSPIAAD